MNLDLAELGWPLRIRPSIPLDNEELMRFCAVNEPLRVERDGTGELIVMSPTGMDGAGMELEVAAELRNWARSDGRGKAFGPTAGMTLPDGSVRAADAAWISWTRWNALTRQQQQGFAPVCPEFVIEVRSATDGLPDLREKMAMWLRSGVELGWLVDPQRKVVEIFRPGREPELVEGASAVEGEGPVEGFVLELGTIWS